MKHQNKSASPCELAYSIDDPPRPVSISENSSMGDVYLSAVLEYPAWCVHRLRCPHLSDHPTQEAKQHSNPDHERTVPTFLVPVGALLGPSGRELRVAQAWASPARTLPVQSLPASSTPPSTLNTEVPQPIHARSACSAYPFEKIRNPIQPSSVSLQTSLRAETTAETTAEILLRFAETSQQTLRRFSLLPTTYINFAAKNALKSNLLRLLRLDPNVDSVPPVPLIRLKKSAFPFSLSPSAFPYPVPPGLFCVRTFTKPLIF
jgi:hypothetical protein